MREEKTIQIPIPEGFKCKEGTVANGFIYASESIVDKGLVVYSELYGEFVWIPVSVEQFKKTEFNRERTIFAKDLEKYGSLAGFAMGFRGSSFGYCPGSDLAHQKQSVEKYRGFFISRYHISKGIDGKPQSRKGFIPWVDIEYDEAYEVSKFVKMDGVTSHLILGEEFDCMLNWCGYYVDLLTKNCINLGNIDWTFSIHQKNFITKTGEKDIWQSKHIYDWVGNVYSWTQEKDSYPGNYETCYLIRGASFREQHPPGRRVRERRKKDDLGFRVCLTIN